MENEIFWQAGGSWARDGVICRFAIFSKWQSSGRGPNFEVFHRRNSGQISNLPFFLRLGGLWTLAVFRGRILDAETCPRAALLVACLSGVFLKVFWGVFWWGITIREFLAIVFSKSLFFTF